MRKKKILTVGFSICSEDVGCRGFISDKSLMGWDIILFRPNINGFATLLRTHDEGLKEQTEHWRREIKEAINNDKLVIVYLNNLENATYFDRKIMSKGGDYIVDYSNYDFMPIDIKSKLNLISDEGKAIKLSTKDPDIVSSYWGEFSEHSKCKVVLEGNFSSCLVTKYGKKTVGAIIRYEHSNGALVLLPDINFRPPYHFDKIEPDDVEEEFATNLVKSILIIDKNLRGDGVPEPEWAKSEEFKLEIEKLAEKELQAVENKIEEIQVMKDSIEKKIKDLGRLRNLLFANGKPLELAVLDALKILEFDDVHSVNHGESEFDVIFESGEGRFIGEVGGKDDGPIDVKKFRQLIHNIYEDFERDDVKTQAKGVLFGNAYRRHPLPEREEPFTQKCIAALKTNPVALVSTPDLFEVAKYLSENSDSHFATECRKALLNSVGRVKFPEIPSSGGNPNKSRQEN